MILVGKIINTHGLKGFIKIKPFTDFPERFFPKAKLMMENESGNFVNFIVTDSFYKGDIVFVKFNGLENIDDVEPLINKELYIKDKDLMTLDDDTYYIHDLIGINILDENDNHIGILSDVFQITSNDIYEATTKKGKKFLIPAVKHFIEKIDIEKKVLKLKTIDGILN